MSVVQSQQKLCERASSLGQPLDDRDADVRGFGVRDAEGHNIGVVKDLLLDPDSWKVRLMEVGTGGFAGIAQKHHLVPIDLVQAVGPDSVRLTVPSESVGESPEYRSDLSPEDELDHYAEVYSWYGVQPYWQDGYRYPPFPTVG